MIDKIIKIGDSMIQHGTISNRVYLMKLSKSDYPEIIDQIYNLAKENGYTKIFAKVPQWAKEGFENKGYKTEAFIPHFFKGIDNAYFMSLYFDEFRKNQMDRQKAIDVINFTKKTNQITEELKLENHYGYHILSQNDAEDMTSVYKAVFESYPFPIFDPEYIKQTMNENIVYFGIRNQGQLIAVSSCEMDIENKNVEMTDFATLPNYRSRGFASFLLAKMEKEMLKRGIITAYTIARSISFGMNATFSKHKYILSGTLINNTNICGSIESMNVWYKSL